MLLLAEALGDRKVSKRLRRQAWSLDNYCEWDAVMHQLYRVLVTETEVVKQQVYNWSFEDAVASDWYVIDDVIFEQSYTVEAVKKRKQLEYECGPNCNHNHVPIVDDLKLKLRDAEVKGAFEVFMMIRNFLVDARNSNKRIADQAYSNDQARDLASAVLNVSCLNNVLVYLDSVEKFIKMK